MHHVKPSSVLTSFQITNVVSFNGMALFFWSLQALPRFGGKPKDDAIFDISKNGRQLGARPQSTLVATFANDESSTDLNFNSNLLYTL